MLVSEKTIQAEVLSNFSKWVILGRNSAKGSKNLATNVIKNPARGLEKGARIKSAAVSRNLRQIYLRFPTRFFFAHS